MVLWGTGARRLVRQRRALAERPGKTIGRGPPVRQRAQERPAGPIAGPIGTGETRDDTELSDRMVSAALRPADRVGGVVEEGGCGGDEVLAPGGCIGGGTVAVCERVGL